MSTVRRYGADGFGSGWQDGDERTVAWVQFRHSGKLVRFVLPLPSAKETRFHRTPKRRTTRTPKQAEAAWEQECRQRWRALALCIKAKLEAVEAGIATFESEFLANIVLPDGRTVGDHALPAIERAYVTGVTPRLLPPGMDDEVVEAEVV